MAGKSKYRWSLVLKSLSKVDDMPIVPRLITSAGNTVFAAEQIKVLLEAGKPASVISEVELGYVEVMYDEFKQLGYDCEIVEETNRQS